MIKKQRMQRIIVTKRIQCSRNCRKRNIIALRGREYGNKTYIYKKTHDKEADCPKKYYDFSKYEREQNTGSQTVLTGAMIVSFLLVSTLEVLPFMQKTKEIDNRNDMRLYSLYHTFTTTTTTMHHFHHHFHQKQHYQQNQSPSN